MELHANDIGLLTKTTFLDSYLKIKLSIHLPIVVSCNMENKFIVMAFFGYDFANFK